MAGETGSSKSTVRTKISEWKKTKAAERAKKTPSYNHSDSPY